MTYQWQKDGQPILGATGTITATPTDTAPQAVLVLPKGSASAGTYTCVVTNPGGSATSDAAIVKPGLPPGNGKTNGKAN